MHYKYELPPTCKQQSIQASYTEHILLSLDLCTLPQQFLLFASACLCKMLVSVYPALRYACILLYWTITIFLTSLCACFSHQILLIASSTCLAASLVPSSNPPSPAISSSLSLQKPQRFSCVLSAARLPFSQSFPRSGWRPR